MKVFITIFFSFFVQSLLAQLNADSFKAVNSPYDELQPVLSADKTILFFTVANHPQNIGGKKDPGDIWYSVLSGGRWSLPVHGGVSLNDRGYNAVAGTSFDGNQLFLLGHYDLTGALAKTQGIAVSKNDGTGWSKPSNISIPYFQNKSSIFHGYITPDKGVFIFSAETYGTRGVEDIYVSINEDGRWTAPKNLGDKINTQFQESSPSISADGKVIYFSSNGRKGKGSFDVYYAERLDDTWSNWSAPVNLTSVNTEGRELFYTAYEDIGVSIFTSTKNSDGYGDINVFIPEKPLVKRDSIVASVDTLAEEKLVVKEPIALKEETPVSKMVKVYGKVTNAKTGEALNADIVLSAPGFNQTVTSTVANGFSVDITPGNVYTVKIQAQGFVSALEHFDMSRNEMQEFEMNIKLQPVEVGITVNLKSVLFERGTSNLLPESNDELNVVVSFLKTNPSIKIELNGHTDNRGVHADNVKLSQERVDRVKQYLVSNGIESKRITGKGFGGLKPIASNESEETRRLNRRVEFTIKKF
jgi:outer membrane protein OmpA-like peptidoglycan-associated protein